MMPQRPVGPAGFTAEEVVGWNDPPDNRSLKAEALEKHHFHPIRCFGADGDALLACLLTDEMKSAFQRYVDWDKSAAVAQKRYKRYALWVVLATVAALVLCLLMLIPPAATANGIAWLLGGGARLAAFIEEQIRYFAPLAVFVLLLLTPALSLWWRPQRYYPKWQRDRANAEAMRREIFTHLMRMRPQPGANAGSHAWDPAWLLQLKLEYFRRWQVEVQKAYFDKRSKELRKQANRALLAKYTYGAALVAFGLVLLASLVSGRDEQGVVFGGAASGVVAPALSLLATVETVNSDYWLLLVIAVTLLVGGALWYSAFLAKALRDAARYKTMGDNFAEVVDPPPGSTTVNFPRTDTVTAQKLARARAAAAANDEDGVLDYVNSVHAMMSLESNDWVRLGEIEWGLADRGLRQNAAAGQARVP
jgi:uncharacterized membrane protein HdeD (DUF308 family)